MKKTLYTTLLVFFIGQVYAQKEISWTLGVKKISANTYEIRLLAVMQHPWHIYSQRTPEGGPLPTKITFAKNPLITFRGKPKEVGKLEQKHEAVFDIDVQYYSGNVDFVQTVRLKKPIKTTVDVAIEYMICNDELCQPPTTQKFTIALGE
jgi:Disulphide bond corrector protein DsbC